MGADHQLVTHAMTKADYDRLEREGKLTRPLTDRPSGRRNSMPAPVAPSTPTKGT